MSISRQQHTDILYLMAMREVALEAAHKLETNERAWDRYVEISRLLWTELESLVINEEGNKENE